MQLIQSLIYSTMTLSPSLILINFIFTIMVYLMPIIIFRFWIYKKGVKKKTAILITVIHILFAIIVTVELQVLINGRYDRLTGAFVLYGMINYSILQYGYKEPETSISEDKEIHGDKETRHEAWNWKAIRSQSDFQNNTSLLTKSSSPNKRSHITVYLACFFLAIILIVLGIAYVPREYKYWNARSLKKSKDFTSANRIFTALGDYRDSKEQIHNHKFTKVVEGENATCEKDGYMVTECSCGLQKRESLSKEHVFLSATCTEPSTCFRCGITTGKATGHSKNTAFCTECGIQQFEEIRYTRNGTYTLERPYLPKGTYKITIQSYSDYSMYVYFDGRYIDRIAANSTGTFTYEQKKTDKVEMPVIKVDVDSGKWTVIIQAIK